MREVSRVHITRVTGINNEVNEEEGEEGKVERENEELDGDWEGMVVQREEERGRDDDVEEDEENVVDQITKVKPGGR